MAVTKWDEESVNTLFREYQRSRDGVSYEYYREIMEAARDLSASRIELSMDSETEKRVSAISDAARASVAVEEIEDRSQVVDWSSNRKTSWLDQLTRDFQEFVHSLNPAKWVPVAVTAALVVAVVPFVLDTTDTANFDQQFASNVEVLQSHDDAVSREIQELQGFQLGFSSSSSDFSTAFNAGTLFVDLVSLRNSSQADLIQNIEQSLKSTMGTRVDFEPYDESLETHAKIALLGDRLQQYYSENDYSSVFVLGQWVESSYLLAKVAQQESQIDDLRQSLGEVGQIETLLENSGHANAMISSDLAAIQQLLDSDEFAQPQVEKSSLLLLKMRSYLAGM